MADAFEMILLSFIGPMVRCEWQCTKLEEAFLTTSVFVGTVSGIQAMLLVVETEGRCAAAVTPAMGTRASS